VTSKIKLPTEWGVDKNIKWTYDFEGVSWSSPIISGDKVIISTSVSEKSVSGLGQGFFTPRTQPAPQDSANTQQQQQQQPPPPPSQQEEEEDKKFLEDIFRWEVSCIDIKTGELIWKQVAHKGNPRIKTHVGNTYASETPVTDGKRIYVYFGMLGLYCYDMDGQLLWEKDLGSFETLNGWGAGSSPVVRDNKVFIQIDNEINSFVIALDASTGEEKWQVEREEKTSYSTPIIWKNKIRTELITTGKTARSYNPVTGEYFWELDLGGEMSIPSAVGDADLLYLGNAGGRDTKGNLFAVKAGAGGNITPKEGELTSEGVQWSIQDAGTGNPSPLLYKGLIYVLESRGGKINCYDAETGETVYDEKINKVSACWASPWAYDDKIYFIDDSGVTNVFKAGRQFEVLSQHVLDDKFWASPAITKKTYIFKGADQLYCIAE
jgi:outer membrane protein assembly factor BamB